MHTQVVAGFPSHEADRERLRQDMRKRGSTAPPPAIYPDAVDMPCPECGILCSIGPRSQEKLKEPGTLLRCLWCVTKLTQSLGLEPEIVDLGNPNSRAKSIWD